MYSEWTNANGGGRYWTDPSGRGYWFVPDGHTAETSPNHPDNPALGIAPGEHAFVAVYDGVPREPYPGFFEAQQGAAEAEILDVPTMLAETQQPAPAGAPEFTASAYPGAGAILFGGPDVVQTELLPPVDEAQPQMAGGLWIVGLLAVGLFLFGGGRRGNGGR